MQARSRLPMFLVAAALLGLMAALATLQYRWLGGISEAERERRKATLNAHATAFAQDFDRELTRAYLTFALDPGPYDTNLATRVATRHDRWQSTARFPRMVRDVYVVRGGSGEPGEPELQRYNPGGSLLEPAQWPEAFAPLRAQMRPLPRPQDRTNTFIHLAPSAWEDIPALVINTPVLFFSQDAAADARHIPVSVIVQLDREYISREMLPSLAQQHFVGADGADYQLAVVRSAAPDVVYRSTEQFSPAADSRADASMDLFQVRIQEFAAMAGEIRRFSTFVAAAPKGPEGRVTSSRTVQLQRPDGQVVGRLTMQDAPMSIIVQQGLRAGDRAAAERSAALVAEARPGLSARTNPTASWKLLVQHRAGSLEAAVDATRRRNLAISSGVLALLGVSVGFLVVSTRRAQELARQQMEFVAAVSHELRTPLAVIRSAGDNLADGVVHDEARIRRYGDLVRSEGRRLSEMVEQILELAGIQSGQRGFALRPVAVQPLLEDIVGASATLIEEAGIAVEYDIQPGLPPVLADEAALRRALQNLVGNAIKYGAGGRWIGLRAVQAGRDVRVSVADRGIGIPATEQSKIFDPFYRAPDVIAAQIQGAGLGLSLVKRIVEAHGGRITLQSTPGAGSEFTVALPAATGDPLPRSTVADSHGAPAPTHSS